MGFQGALEPRVVFEDPHLIVIIKPAGLLSQGESTGDANVVDWCRQKFGRNYVGLVHRLDRNTSGLMVVAKRSKSAQRLTDALQSGDLVRKYLAILSDPQKRLSGPAQIWKHRLVKNEKTNITEVISGDPNAILTAKPLFSLSGKTICEFELQTGKSHQIRAQAAHLGYPLWGDVKYGEKSGEFHRPALHSYFLSFPHPKQGEAPLSFSDLQIEDWPAPIQSELARMTQPFK